MACLRPVRVDLASQVKEISVCEVGISAKLRTVGVNLFLSSLHFPHRQREDCEEVWEQACLSLRSAVEGVRHHDHMIWGIDANLDLGSNCDGSLRSVHAHSLLHDLGLHVSQNRGITWQNHNACTYIDFVLYRGLGAEELKGHTDWNAAEFVQSDHACVSAAIQK